MNDPKLLQRTLREWSTQAELPHDLAERALAGSRRRRRLLRVVPLVTAAAAVAVVAAVGVPGIRDVVGLPADDGQVTSTSDVHADTKNNPPEKLIAAGRIAVSAISTIHQERLSDGSTALHRSWSLYNPNNGEYERTSWSWLDVAPGLRQAAVLEGGLPSSRIGILNMRTRAVSWISVDHPVAGLAWSPDGTKVLATAYTKDPDVFKKLSGDSTESFPSTRTGFLVVDVATGTSAFHSMPPRNYDFTHPDRPSNSNSRQDMGWSLDGSSVWETTDGAPGMLFYDIDGRSTTGDDPSGYLLDVSATPQSAVSPDGKLLVSKFSGLPTEVSDRATGRSVGKQKVLQLLAWADNDHLIAVGGGAKSEFQNNLVLVSVDGGQLTALSAHRNANGGPNYWQWLLTRRRPIA